MSKFRKKPVVIEAVQWMKHGDNSDVDPYPENLWSHRRAQGIPGCEQCHCHFADHGQIPTLEGDHIVCPGDWIITGIKGEKYPCKPDIFEATYEPVEEQ